MQLTHPRFGDFEHRRNLLEVHVVLVVHAHHVLLTLGQLLDGVDERLPHAVILQLRQRVHGFLGHVTIQVFAVLVSDRQLLQDT